MRAILFLTVLLLHFPPLSASDKNLVARIEKYGSVIESDLSDWQGAQDCYPEGMHARQAAFMQLFETTILETLLKQDFKFELGPKDYQKERERIDRETDFPEVIKCIRNRLHSTKRYDYIFTRPILVNKNFYSRLPNDNNIQVRPRMIAKQIETQIRDGKSFKETAGAFHVEFSTLTFYYPMPSEDILPVKERPPESVDIQEEYGAKYLSVLSPGEISRAIEKEDQIVFIKLLAKEGYKYRFERLVIEKIDQRKYFDSLKKLKVTIYDTDLKNWVQSIKGNSILKALEITP